MDAVRQARDDWPRLLMISGCVPDAQGAASQRRAWRLLETASRGWAVHLICIADRRVNLCDWRRLDGLTYRHALLPTARDRVIQRTAREAVTAWQSAASFDMALCDTNRLWPVAEQVQPSMLIDATDHAAALRALLTPAQPLPQRLAA